MHIGVLGAGSMGHGIAQVSAIAGHDVVLRDIETGIVEHGIKQIAENLGGAIQRDKITEEKKIETLDRIEGTTDLEETVSDADLVIEAALEDMELKKSIFTDTEKLAPTDTIIATNTSSLSVTELASVLDNPSRVLGLHFFNPAHIMPLVEIIVAEQTTKETKAQSDDYVESIGKTPVTVQDFPGFASSRLSAMSGIEAVQMVQEGVASIEDIDQTMQLGYNHPMGPIELIDHTGIDVNVEVMEYLRNELGERFKPPQLLKQKYRAGKLGRKTGEGFYIWEDGEMIGTSDG